MKFYQEPNGDYLCLHGTGARLERGQRIYEGRATAIAGLVTSMSTTGIGERFLQECKRVQRRAVPAAWHKAMLGD